MALALSLPSVEARPANPPETRFAKVGPWLTLVAQRGPADAARVIGDALAATNRVAMSDSKRLELAEAYWATAMVLWPQLEKTFVRASHPLGGEALESAKAALTLAHELSVAFKHLLASESQKRLSLGGSRLLTALILRCLQCFARILSTSYLSYSPVPQRTWHDAHAVYAFARERNLHLASMSGTDGDATPEVVYVQALLLALANPYGFHPGQLMHVLRYLANHAHIAKLTNVAPVHRMAKAVAIVPIGHDFPPFSANKGGSIEGSRLFLLTYDLAFELQEQLSALEHGGPVPEGVGRSSTSRHNYVALLRRLLRQWAIPPARQFNRLPSRARVAMCAGVACVWQSSRGQQAAAASPAMTQCQVINHTPAGYALRQLGDAPCTLRIGDLIALRVDGRPALQVAMVRWFRNTLKSSALEFGCELLSEAPEAAAAAAEDGEESTVVRVVVLPEEGEAGAEPSPPQLVVPTGSFALEQAITLRRGKDTGFAVLTKLVEQGPGFELFEFVAVG
jgi:cyclic-di-GMP-binding protein